MGDVEESIVQVRVLLTSNHMITEPRVELKYNELVERDVVTVSFKMAALNRNESDFTQLVRAIRAKVPRTYPVRVTFQTWL